MSSKMTSKATSKATSNKIDKIYCIMSLIIGIGVSFFMPFFDGGVLFAFPPVIVAALIGAGVTVGGAIIKGVSESEERKRQGKYLQGQADKLKGLYGEWEKTGFDPSQYEKLESEMEAMFAGLSTKAKDEIYRNSKVRIAASNKAFQGEIDALIKSFERQGGKLNEFYAKNIKQYGRDVDKLSKQGVRQLSTRRMGGSDLLMSFIGKQGEQLSKHTQKLNEQNKKAQEEIAYQKGERVGGLSRRREAAESAIGESAAHRAAMTGLDYDRQAAQSKYQTGLARLGAGERFEAQKRAGLQGLQRDIFGAEGMGGYMAGTPFQWGGVAQAGLGAAGGIGSAFATQYGGDAGKGKYGGTSVPYWMQHEFAPASGG